MTAKEAKTALLLAIIIIGPRSDFLTTCLELQILWLTQNTVTLKTGLFTYRPKAKPL